MLLICTQTGLPQAILLDNGYLTEVRTAAAGAIAANYLSRKNIETVGVIGAGSQARYQARALKLVRDFKKSWSIPGQRIVRESMPWICRPN